VNLRSFCYKKIHLKIYTFVYDKDFSLSLIFYQCGQCALIIQFSTLFSSKHRNRAYVTYCKAFNSLGTSCYFTPDRLHRQAKIQQLIYYIDLRKQLKAYLAAYRCPRWDNQESILVCIMSIICIGSHQVRASGKPRLS